MSDMRESFLNAIKQDRYDIATRMAFADWLMENGFDEEAHKRGQWTVEKEQEIETAENWLKQEASSHVYVENYASSIYGSDAKEIEREVTYEELIQAGYDYKNTHEIHEYKRGNNETVTYHNGDRFVQVGGESLRDMDNEKLKKFWECWCLVTGEEIDFPPEENSPFSCSC